MKCKEKKEKNIKKERNQYVPSSFDLLGNKEKEIAIVEIPKELKNEKDKIAEAIMSEHKNVVSVLNKKSKRKGTYRLREYEKIKGECTEVVHREHGCDFAVDPTRVYFSTRESTERQRISNMLEKGEKVLVMFSGICPYPIIIAKSVDVKKIYAIEINPDAHKYALENIKRNNVEDKILCLEGDVRDICEDIYDKFDRVIMPLPESGDEFLDITIQYLKKNGICHYYCICTDDEIKKEKDTIESTANKLDRKIEFIGEQKVLQWGPNIWKMRIDFKVF